MPLSTKYIFISGGVLSSLGKGITTSSLALLLQAKGYSVTVVKCENYLNIDSGLINPLEHGDAFLCEDGTETDPASDTWDTPGELCLAGPQVGLGYLNRDAQTAEAFVDSLHPDLDGGRMYRTGDIVAWTEVGGQRILQFLGRIGDQVKIRGNRVELGEVETRLRELSGVRQAAAVAIDEDGAQALVGFLVAEDGVTPDLTALATQLATEVPEYMVPSRFRVVDTLPMNHNGKLDRKALATLL